SVSRSEPIARTTRAPQRSRREQVEESLKELDIKSQRSKKLPLTMKIAQAGLSWSKQKFFVISGAIGLFAFAAVLLAGVGLLPAAAAGFAGGFGVPMWLLSYLKKRREKQFLNGFPDAVDVIVRGIKA